jgi:GAF domain-containing protein
MMPLLIQTVEFFSQYPGSLIYHFGVLFALEATLGIALGYRQRPAIRRIALAAGGMLAGRLVLMVLALLASQQLIADPAAIWPPLERAVDAIGVWLLVWALLPLFDSRPQHGDLVAGGVSLLLLVLYLFFAVAWYTKAAEAGAIYSGTTQETAWGAIQLAILGAAGIYTLFDRRGDWTLRLGILSVLLAAHVAQLGWALPEENTAGWARLGQLIAFPLLTVSAYRLVIAELRSDAASQPPEPVARILEQAKQLGSIAATMDEASIVKAATAAISSITGSKAVALLVLAEPAGADLPVVQSVSAIYRDGQSVPWPEGRLRRDDAPALRRALHQKRDHLLRPGGADDPSRLSLLMQLLPETPLKTRLESALVIQPIHWEKQCLGLLLVQPTAGAAEWPANKRRLFDTLAGQVAAALAHGRAHLQLQERADQIAEQLERAKPGTDEQVDQLKADLNEARQVGRRLAGELEAARQQVASTHGDVKRLTALLEDQAERAEKANRDQQAAIAALQRQLSPLAPDAE